MHANLDIADGFGIELATRLAREAATISVTNDLATVEADWRQLEEFGVESPGQTFDFIRGWVNSLGISRACQVYLTARQHGRPVALLALRIERHFGVRVLSFIPGAHVGSNAPLVDPDWFEAMDEEDRRAFWQRVFLALPAADAILLQAVPNAYLGRLDLFAGLGRRGASDVLYRSEFSSWTECDDAMRKSKQRKRDRQQGEKLAALGEVTYGTATPDDFETVLAATFRQKAERFAVLGIADPFADQQIRAAYLEILKGAKTLKPELFVLRVNGEIAATRYALGVGDRLFALITSMSEDPKLQAGSPGRQEIFRTVQSIFERGYRVFDIGLSLNDEKRAWCNNTHRVTTLYFPRTPGGFIWSAIHRLRERAKYWIKADQARFAFYKRLRAKLPAAFR
jgi:CelD/BcsL family acetyltransferase involved in cellulose biosynthesis